MCSFGMSTKEEEIDLPSLHWFHNLHTEEFEDTKDSQHNGQKKNEKRTSNELKTIQKH